MSAPSSPLQSRGCTQTGTAPHPPGRARTREQHPVRYAIPGVGTAVDKVRYDQPMSYQRSLGHWGKASAARHQSRGIPRVVRCDVVARHKPRALPLQSFARRQKNPCPAFGLPHLGPGTGSCPAPSTKKHRDTGIQGVGCGCVVEMRLRIGGRLAMSHE